MGEKVTFDPVNKIIQCKVGTVDLDVRTDIYSDGKEDWIADSNLNKYLFPVSAIGGQPLPGSKVLGTTYFLNYGWRIRPQEANHTLNVNGNLYTDTGDSPFVGTVGSFNVTIISTVSNLVDSTVAQLAEIEYASFENGVTIDITSPYSVSNPPTDGKILGTPRAPVNNIADAYAIAVERGFITFYVKGNLSITSAVPDLEDFTFIGQGMDRTEISIDDAANVNDCAYENATVTGVLDGNSRLSNCLISDLVYVKGIIESCVLAPGTITLAGSEEAHFLDCWSGVPGLGTPIINVGSGQALALRNYNGGITLTNKTGPEAISIDLNSGQVILTDTVVNGEIVIRGVGKIVDNSNGADVYSEDFISPDNIAAHVWQYERA